MYLNNLHQIDKIVSEKITDKIFSVSFMFSACEQKIQFELWIVPHYCRWRRHSSLFLRSLGSNVGVGTISAASKITVRHIPVKWPSNLCNIFHHWTISKLLKISPSKVFHGLVTVFKYHFFLTLICTKLFLTQKIIPLQDWVAFTSQLYWIGAEAEFRLLICILGPTRRLAWIRPERNYKISEIRKWQLLF